VTLISTLRAAAIAAPFLVAATAWADEPGPGGTKPLMPVTGEQVYKQVCAACHMADGKGAVGAGAFPSLANNPRLAAPAYPIVMVAKGKGGMPWFNDTLNPAQIAGVVTYIRTHFGNDYPAPVTEANVRQFAGMTETH
jgi:mono/diheme cytochrome c family protein